MVTIEYDNIKVSVPEGWDDITVGLYEKVYGQNPKTHRERATMVATLCNVEPDLLFNWPADVFAIILDKIGFLYEDTRPEPSPLIELEGIKYIVPIEEKLTLGAWVDIDDVQKTGEAVLSKILAIVCRPAGEAYTWENNEKRAAMFAALPVSKVLPVLGFFLHCKTAYDKRTTAYLKIDQAVGLLAQNIKTFVKPGGGIRLSQTWLIIRFWTLTVLLRYRWAKFLRTYNTAAIKKARTPRSVS